MFCLELQKLLKPIYHLTRKGRHFMWGKEHRRNKKKISPIMKDFIYIQTLVNLLQVVLYIKFKMEN